MERSRDRKERFTPEEKRLFKSFLREVQRQDPTMHELSALIKDAKVRRGQNMSAVEAGEPTQEFSHELHPFPIHHVQCVYDPDIPGIRPANIQEHPHMQYSYDEGNEGIYALTQEDIYADAFWGVFYDVDLNSLPENISDTEKNNIGALAEATSAAQYQVTKMDIRSAQMDRMLQLERGAKALWLRQHRRNEPLTPEDYLAVFAPKTESVELYKADLFDGGALTERLVASIMSRCGMRISITSVSVDRAGIDMIVKVPYVSEDGTQHHVHFGIDVKALSKKTDRKGARLDDKEERRRLMSRFNLFNATVAEIRDMQVRGIVEHWLEDSHGSTKVSTPDRNLSGDELVYMLTQVTKGFSGPRGQMFTERQLQGLAEAAYGTVFTENKAAA